MVLCYVFGCKLVDSQRLNYIDYSFAKRFDNIKRIFRDLAEIKGRDEFQFYILDAFEVSDTLTLFDRRVLARSHCDPLILQHDPNLNRKVKTFEEVQKAKRFDEIRKRNLVPFRRIESDSESGDGTGRSDTERSED